MGYGSFCELPMTGARNRAPDAEASAYHRSFLQLRYKDSELNVGEGNCVDRCVSKYWQVTTLVGQLLGNNRPPM